MGKGYIKGLIAVLSVLVVVLTGIFIYSCFNDGISFGKFEEVRVEKSINADGIKKINIDVSIGEINIKESNSNDIMIEGIVSSNAKNKKGIEIDTSNSTVTVKDTRNNSNFIGNLFGASKIKAKVTVYIPKSYKNMLYIKNSMGDINIEALNGSATIDASMGDIDIEGARINGTLDVSANMGDIDIECRELNGKLAVNNNMGEITLVLDKDINANLDADLSMGDLNIEGAGSQKGMNNGIETVIGEESNNFISLNNDMGDIDVKINR